MEVCAERKWLQEFKELASMKENEEWGDIGTSSAPVLDNTNVQEGCLPGETEWIPHSSGASCDCAQSAVGWIRSPS